MMLLASRFSANTAVDGKSARLSMDAIASYPARLVPVGGSKNKYWCVGT